MTRKKNEFTGQERESHQPLVCSKCGQPGGIKGSPPLRKIIEGDRKWYVHQRSCPLPIAKKVIGANIILPTDEEIARIKASKSPDERIA